MDNYMEKQFGRVFSWELKMKLNDRRSKNRVMANLIVFSASLRDYWTPGVFFVYF